MEDEEREADKGGTDWRTLTPRPMLDCGVKASEMALARGCG